MPLKTSAVPEDPEYYTDQFKVLMRSHRDNLLKNSERQSITDTGLLFACRYDFYKFLAKNKVEPRYWWVHSYINNIETPTQDISKMTYWWLISDAFIDNILTRNNTESS